MQPTIGRSVITGFHVTHRSWSALWLVIGVTIAIAMAAVAVIAVGALLTVGTMARPAPSEPVAPARPAQPVAAAPTASAPAAPAASTDEPATPEPATPSDTPPAAAQSPEAPLDAAQEQPPLQPEQDLGLDDDLSGDLALDEQPAADEDASAAALDRAWPVLLFGGLLFGVALLAVEAGRLGYLARRVRGEAVTLGELWRSSRERFVPLLGAFGLTALALLVLGPLWLLTAPMAGNPDTQAVGWLLIALEIAAWVWLTVRLGFWWIAVVADRLGPIKGLVASWRLTQRRWWKTFGLWGVLGLISLLVSLPLFGLEYLGRSVGGPGGVTLLVLTAIGRLLLNTYLAFVVAAALIRYYDDAKAATS